MHKTYTAYLYCPLVLRPLLPIPWQNKKPAGSSSIAIEDEPSFAFGEAPAPAGFSNFLTSLLHFFKQFEKYT
jgi:hypothetical protein